MKARVRSLLRLLPLVLACRGDSARDARDLVVAVPADGYSSGSSDAALALYPVNTTVYEPLVRLGAHYEVQPLLATRWELRAGGTWRFHLRRGVRFHDGSAFTAEAVRWTFGRMARRGTGTLGIDTNSTRVIDDSTVDVTPVVPNRRLPEQLTHPSWSIMAPGSDPSTHPQGTGPFRFVEYRPSDHITVARFDDYWGTRAAVDRMTFQFIPDPATRVLALRAGDVDVVSEFPREVRDPRVVRSPVSGYEVLYLTLHGSAPHDLGGELAVRRAVASTIDRARIAREVWLGAAESTPTVVPAELLGAHASLVHGASHDPSAARALLDSVGWLPGPDGIRRRNGRRLALVMVVGFPNPYIHRPMPEIVQATLRQIGIEVRIAQVPDDAAFQARIKSGDGDLWAEAGGQNDANPCFLAHLLFYSGARARPSGYARLFAPGPALDRFVAACRNALTRDDEQRNAAEAEHVLVDETAVVVPLAATRRVWGVSERVHGFVPHPSSLSQRWELVSLSAGAMTTPDSPSPGANAIGALWILIVIVLLLAAHLWYWRRR